MRIWEGCKETSVLWKNSGIICYTCWSELVWRPDVFPADGGYYESQIYLLPALIQRQIGSPSELSHAGHVQSAADNLLTDEDPNSGTDWKPTTVAAALQSLPHHTLLEKYLILLLRSMRQLMNTSEPCDGVATGPGCVLPSPRSGRVRLWHPLTMKGTKRVKKWMDGTSEQKQLFTHWVYLYWILSKWWLKIVSILCFQCYFLAKNACSSIFIDHVI